MQTALDWAMSAEILTADKLLAAGYCTKVVEPEDLLPEARALARRYIDGLSPVSVAVATGARPAATAARTGARTGTMGSTNTWG